MSSTETVVQTVVLNLETSDRKNNKIQKCIDEYQSMSKYMSDAIVSVDQNEWSTMNPAFYRMLNKEFEERYVSSGVALESIEDVIGGYKSWVSNGKIGEKPVFGNSNYVRCKAKAITIEKNDRSYGIKFNIVPYKPEWFRVNGNTYCHKYLEKVVNGKASVGTCEIHKEGKSLNAHLVVKWEVESRDDDEYEQSVGVDIGENVIYSLSVLDEKGVQQVEMKNGAKFRHYRERLKQKRKEMMAKDDLRGVKECSGEHDRYTQQVLDTASREIIDVAKEYSSPKICLENLTNYRKTADNPIHDWPYALFQEKIIYKAKEYGIPVETVNPRNTSKTCRACGHTHSSNRSGIDFECKSCGYQVHADVNASMNIALRGSRFERDEYENVSEDSGVSGVQESLLSY